MINFTVTTQLDETVKLFEVDLSKCRSYLDFSHSLKRYNIKKYTYIFYYDDEILKIGLSNDENSHMVLERVYRLTGHLPGWPSSLSGPSGREMVKICEDFYYVTGKRVHKNGVRIQIFDWSGIDSPTSDPNFLTKKHERHLIKLYEDKYHTLPVGNIKDESYMDQKNYVDTVIFKEFFTEEN